MSPTATKKKCAGCGRERVTGYHSDLVDVELFDGEMVLVCAGRGTGSKDCIAKARLGHCAGCGKEPSRPTGYSGTLGVLCDDCRRALGRGREKDDGTKAWTYLTRLGFFGGYMGSVDYDLGRQACQALAKAVGGVPRERLGSEPARGCVPPAKDHFGDRVHPDAAVETTEVQHEGLIEFQGFLSQIGDAIRKEAFRRGSDVLGKLVNGESTISDFEERVEKERG